MLCFDACRCWCHKRGAAATADGPAFLRTDSAAPLQPLRELICMLNKRQSCRTRLSLQFSAGMGDLGVQATDPLVFAARTCFQVWKSL
jgi:hypothetical protein